MVRILCQCSNDSFFFFLLHSLYRSPSCHSQWCPICLSLSISFLFLLLFLCMIIALGYHNIVFSCSLLTATLSCCCTSFILLFFFSIYHSLSMDLALFPSLYSFFSFFISSTLSLSPFLSMLLSQNLSYTSLIHSFSYILLLIIFYLSVSFSLSVCLDLPFSFFCLPMSFVCPSFCLTLSVFLIASHPSPL